MQERADKAVLAEHEGGGVATERPASAGVGWEEATDGGVHSAAEQVSGEDSSHRGVELETDRCGYWLVELLLKWSLTFKIK